jgi:hypothetical protein
MKEALAAVLRRPRLLVEQAAAYLLLGYLGYLWLGLPVGHMWQLAVLLVTALLWFTALLWIARRPFVMLRRDAPRVPMPQIILFGAVLAGIGILGPWWLIGWVPGLDSLASQAISFFTRFGLAYLLIIGCWLTFASLVTAAGTPSSTHENNTA